MRWAVVTPDFAHRDPIVAAAEAEKHIITEKPLATTLEDAEAIAKAVRKAGITFMVDFHARWNPPLAIARQNITEGKLGRIVSAYFRLNDTISVPTEMLSWAEKSSTSVNDIKVNILGSKGMINMDLTNNQMIERYLEDSTDHPDCLVKPQVRDRHVGFAYESIRNFVDCLFLGKEVQANLEDGLNVTKVVLAIMESASTGVPVTVRY